MSSLEAKALFRAVQVTHVKLWDSSTSAPAKKARLRGSSQKKLGSAALVKKARLRLLSKKLGLSSYKNVYFFCKVVLLFFFFEHFCTTCFEIE